MTLLLLAAAILFEVGGTLSLRMATHGRRVWFIGVVVGYVAAFGFLSLTLQAGMTIGVAYGIWTAVGVLLTATLGRILFREPFTWVMALGAALIVGGVVLVETGASG